MQRCPHCGGVYPAGQGYCPFCGEDEPESAASDESAEAVGQTIEVTIATFPAQPQAEMWAEVLRNAGIPSVLVPLNPGAGGWGTSLWGPYALRIRAVDVDHARQILPETE